MTLGITRPSTETNNPTPSFAHKLLGENAYFSHRGWKSCNIKGLFKSRDERIHLREIERDLIK